MTAVHATLDIEVIRSRAMAIDIASNRVIRPGADEALSKAIMDYCVEQAVDRGLDLFVTVAYEESAAAVLVSADGELHTISTADDGQGHTIDLITSTRTEQTRPWISTEIPLPAVSAAAASLSEWESVEDTTTIGGAEHADDHLADFDVAAPVDNAATTPESADAAELIESACPGPIGVSTTGFVGAGMGATSGMPAGMAVGPTSLWPPSAHEERSEDHTATERHDNALGAKGRQLWTTVRDRAATSTRAAGRVIADNRRSILSATAMVMVLAGVAAFVLHLMSGPSAPAAKPDLAIPPQTTQVATPVSDDCPTRTDGPVTTGRDAGDQRTGAGVIKAFDYAYYVDRSGAAARSMMTSTTRTAASIQAGINQIDKGTRHCLKIVDLGRGLYTVELTETPPAGQEPIIRRQRIQTVIADGRAWIVSITKDS